MRRILVAVALVVFLTTGGIGKASLIVNGSFEEAYEGAQLPSSFNTLVAGEATADDIKGWTVTANSIDWIGAYWGAADGQRSVDLSGDHPGTIVGQDFSTKVGQQYVVKFEMAGNPDNQSLKTLRVTVADVDQLFLFDSTGKTKDKMGWVQHSLAFVATDTTTSLSFKDEGVTAWGVALDNVSVHAVPEPKTLAIWSTLSTLGLIAVRRRRKQAA